MEETFFPIPFGSEGHSRANLYRGYKRLVNNISEKLHKGEVLSLAYQHDLPSWFVEIGPMHEPGYALRVLSQMEGRQVFSPTNLKGLSQSLDTIGRVDLVNMIKTFEDQHRETMDSVCVNSVSTSINFTSVTPEPQFVREEPRRSSLGSTRRYLQDTFGREEKHSLSSIELQQGTRSLSENRSRHGSFDKYSMDRSREGTPFESIMDPVDPPLPQDVNLGIEMSKMSTETLGNQLQLVQQMLTNHCLASPSVHHSLTNAYLLTKQISSLLNIASDSIKMVPMTRYHNNYDNDQSPIHSTQNSSGEVTKHNSQGSLTGCGQAFNNWYNNGTSDVQRDRGGGIYRTHSQPQVFHNETTFTRDLRNNNMSVTSFGSSYSQPHSEYTKATANQFSPLEFTDVAFAETPFVHSIDMSSISNVPPPLPPRPSHIASSLESKTRIFEPVRHVNIGDELSPVTKQGYHLMRPSNSVQELNKLLDSDNIVKSKSLSRSRNGSNSSRKFFGKKKPAVVSQ